MKSNLQDIEVIFIHETKSAFLLAKDEDDIKGSWFPKSQCEIEGELKIKGVVTLTCEQWLLEEKGFV